MCVYVYACLCVGVQAQVCYSVRVRSENNFLCRCLRQFLVAGANPASLGASGDSPGSSLHLALQALGLLTSFRVLLMWVLGEGFKLRFSLLQWHVLFPLNHLPDLDLKVQKSD